MTILFTICGRAGSKGIRNKNIRKFLKYPLPYYTLSVIDLYLKTINEQVDYDIVINTDSEDLISIMRDNSLRETQIIKRIPELAGDVVCKTAVISNCLDIMTERTGKIYDVVLDLDITSPLRTVNDIIKLMEKHMETGADVTTSVTSARRNPYFNQLKKTEQGYKKVIASNYTARQQAPEIFDMNASLYAYAPAFLRTGKGTLDGYCECIEMYDTGILDLDHENDFELMEVIAQYLFHKNKDFAEVWNNLK